MLAIAWAAWQWTTGHPARGLVGAVAICMAHAAVLAFEFALLWSAHSNDPVPRATLAQLFAAWCGEAVAAPRVFCWRQPFRSRQYDDHLPAGALGRRGLILVHGFVCNRGLWNRWLQRLHAADVPFVAVNLEPVFGPIDDYVGLIEAAARRIELATGMAPVAVGHSMGGLAIRRWWADHADNRLHHAITIGTPHHGTWLAILSMTRNSRQMRQRSAWLQTLSLREPRIRAARFTCFYSHCDNIVFPTSTATLVGADNRHLQGVAHVHMVDRREPFDEAMRWLAAPQ
jgi:pimeloyl-ACP methyl ester carboxylesterase